MPDEFFLDPARVRRSFDVASPTYDAAAVVPAEIRNRLLERLDIVRLQPHTILDLGAGTGHAARALKQRYRAAEVVALDLSPGMLAQAERQQRWLRRFHRVAADAHRLPLRSASVDLILSNLMLEWCHDPDAAFAEMRRLLKPQGLLTFSTLGPDTLKELRGAWRQVDGYTHVHRFIDMHDLGDALVRSGFAEPVMDTERLTVTYPDLDALMKELVASGAGNVAQGRPPGLTGKGRLRALQEEGRRLMQKGRLPVSVEVVYGHAWVGQLAPQRAGSGEVRIPVASLRRPNR